MGKLTEYGGISTYEFMRQNRDLLTDQRTEAFTDTYGLQVLLKGRTTIFETDHLPPRTVEISSYSVNGDSFAPVLIANGASKIRVTREMEAIRAELANQRSKGQGPNPESMSQVIPYGHETYSGMIKLREVMLPRLVLSANPLEEDLKDVDIIRFPHFSSLTIMLSSEDYGIMFGSSDLGKIVAKSMDGFISIGGLTYDIGVPESKDPGYIQNSDYLRLLTPLIAKSVHPSDGVHWLEAPARRPNPSLEV
jgi:hypothetical protein